MTATVTPTLNATAALARWVAGVPDRWSDAALREAGRAFLDTVAVMLAGCRDEAPSRVRSAVAAWGEGAATVVGTPHRLPTPWAALVNGTAAHALDYDDILSPAAGHVSAGLVPALLALGEEQGADGAACLDAYIVGLEVMARLGQAVNMTHYHRGWHTTLTLGAPAAAAACARLLGLDEAAAGAALSISTSMAAGSKLQFGTMTKPLHAGLAAKSGLLAARLAAAGVTAAGEAFEGDWGFHQHYAGPTAPGLQAGLSRLGDPPAIEEHGILFKFYPCCGSTHRSVDALLALREEHGLRPEQVERIVAVISEVQARNLMYPSPRTELEARFSLHYCLAVALVDGKLTLADFTPEAVERPEVRRLLPLVEMRTHPSEPGEPPSRDRSDEVTIYLKGGRSVSTTVSFPRGDPRSPLTDEQLADKLGQATAGVLSPADRDAALAALRGFRSLQSIRDLTRHLRAEE